MFIIASRILSLVTAGVLVAAAVAMPARRSRRHLGLWWAVPRPPVRASTALPG